VPKFVVGRSEEMPPGTRRHVEVDGRGVAVFNVEGAFFALRDVCPHQGARLSDGTVLGWVGPAAPGCYEYDPDRKLVRCPWHGWEYELATGKSWYDPSGDRIRSYDVSVEKGTELVGERRPGPYTAETIPIAVEDEYVVIEL
jgi:3-phenylpropionate/trans-cinnamate dioxygenase ferredoxin subunit